VNPGPAAADPGRDGVPARGVPGPDDFPEDGVGGWRLVPCRADWPDDAVYLAALGGEEEEPPDPDLWEDPGMPGSAQRLPGEHAGPAAGFGVGRELDVAAGRGLGKRGAGRAGTAVGRGAGRPDGNGPGGRGAGEPGPPVPDGPLTGAVPPGFAGRVNLTVPLATVLGLAARPGEIGGIGPIDPALAQDLACAAARNPETTWCITVTDPDGPAIGPGCARGHRHRRRPGPGRYRPARHVATASLTSSGSRGGRWLGSSAGACKVPAAGSQVSATRCSRRCPCCESRRLQADCWNQHASAHAS
jgi:hypothetical protein